MTTGAITGGTGYNTITTLPSGYRPSHQVDFLCQGSGASTWLCQVTTGGTVRMTRYRTGDAWANINNNTWVPMNISFIID